MNLKQTPLFEEHIKRSAKMIPFGGWEMPVQYEGILSEHSAAREKCALFDTSHMGEFTIAGDCQESGLDRLVTSKIKDMPLRSCRYGLLLNEQGGVIDDLIVFREEEKKWFVVVNGATTDKDAEQFQKHLKPNTTFSNLSSELGKLDLQGPRSRDILKVYASGIEKLDYYTFDYFDCLGENVLISRTGYTGELGYEIYFPWKKVIDLWNALLDNKDVKPAGLGARDVLRLEVGYSLYGHEINEDFSPLESGLERFIDFEKDFIGKDALLKQRESGIKRKIIGLLSDSRRAPRDDHKIFSENNHEIGNVTSGTFSPSLNRGIGLGFVSLDYSQIGNKIIFGNEKGKSKAEISKKIFYKGGSLKN